MCMQESAHARNIVMRALNGCAYENGEADSGNVSVSTVICVAALLDQLFTQ